MRVALVLFSGGVDSTYVTARAAEAFDRMLLVTYRVPGMIGVERSRRSADQLRTLLGDKIEHRVIDIRDFVTERRGGVLDCIRDNARYRFFYAWCMGCKVAMHLYTMRYATERGITVVMDGSNYYDTHALEQHKEVKDLLCEVYRARGIEFVTPHYFEDAIQPNRRPDLELLRHLTLLKDSTDHRARHLATLGIHMGFGLGSHYRTNQPSCLTSLAFNGARVPLRLLFKEERGCCYMSHGYLNYIADKIYGGSPSSAAACPTRAPGEATINLDHAATTPLDPAVSERMGRVQAELVGNASALHDLGVRSAEGVEAARGIIAARLGADPAEIVFTSGGTEANNLALAGVALRPEEGRDQLITTRLEHPSVAQTIEALRGHGYDVTYLPVDATGRVDPDDVAGAITARTRLVSVIHGNHEIGTVQPLAEIGAVCRARGVLFHTDACQSFTKVELDVRRDGPDLVSINAHKIHGPTGVGALYVRRGVDLTPLLRGGGQEGGLRSGTLHTAGIAGFGKAVELATPEHARRMTALRDGLLRDIQARVAGVTLNGAPRERLCHHLSLTFEGVTGKAVLARLNRLGIYASTRSACSSRVATPSTILMAIGLTEEQALSTLRVGLSRLTTAEELARFVQALVDVVRAERE